MSRLNEDGKELKIVLEYLLGERVTHRELARALGVSDRKFSTRYKMNDFPDAEECRLIGVAFGINPVALQVSFELVTPQQAENYQDFGMGRPNRALAVPRTERPAVKTSGPLRLRDLGAHPTRRL